MLKVVQKAKATPKGTAARNQELHNLDTQLQHENREMHMAQLHHKQLIEAMEKQLKYMQKALQKERREHELMKRAVELSRRTA